MFNLFKKKYSAEQVASGFYMLIRKIAKTPLQDADGVIILDTQRQSLLLLSHFSRLLIAHKHNEINMQLLNIFVRDNKKIKDEGDLVVELLVLTQSIKKINQFFDNIPQEGHELLKRDWMFKDNPNPVQKVKIIAWYTTFAKVVDKAFHTSSLGVNNK